MKILFTAFLILLIGCATPTSVDSYKKMADKQAREVLRAANESPGLERYKPFKLEEYEQTIREDKDANGREFVSVMYKLTRPVGFMGHPQHFIIRIYKDTKETKVIGGQ